MATTHPSPPQQHERLDHTDDLDRVRAAVSNVLTAHRLGVLERSGLDASLSATNAGKITLMHLGYGATVRIDVTPPERPFHIVQIPLTGAAAIASGRHEMVSVPGIASVPDPRELCSMRWEPDCTQLIVRVDDEHLQRQLQSLIGRPVVDPIRFGLAMDLRTGRGRSWRASLDLLLTEAGQDAGLLEHPLFASQVESVVLSGLLLAQNHNYSAALHAEQNPAAPRYVKEVLERIQAHPDLPLTVERLAADSGVSVRALQRGFHDVVGCSPMAYLREVRLNRAREALAAADPTSGVSVTDVALNWGFMHLGRFSVEYRRRFGESPSQTLRR
ncbi:AraC family transcriptional regulator [Nocardia amamiensis]|uniref:AraC family transcriptional regulator n=1 Tax=Nocardia amamiensis TaxID=404578 RepID=UPI00082BAF21|nr:AraC family transcriptional regulator [Nocardia amamiensis]